tara:strand:- start:2168 stop:2551 length:384 start_codon:yes stop_codon:yes gene_type:complete
MALKAQPIKPKSQAAKKPKSKLTVVPDVPETEAPIRAVPPPQPRKRQTAIYAPSLKIKFTGAPNPVREGTNRAQIWSLLQNDMTVGDFDNSLKTTDKRGKDNKPLVGGHGDLKIAVEKGYIELVNSI